MYKQSEKNKQKLASNQYDFLKQIVHSEMQPEAVVEEAGKHHPMGPLDEPKRAERIVPELIKYIQVHHLVSGSKLPSQRELCDILRVGANSLREALFTLQTIGLVQSRQGAGWYVGKFDPVGNLKFLTPILETYTDTNAEIIIETRMAIEPVFARRAAEYITEEGLKKLEKINQNMVQSGEKKDFDSFREYDKSFHVVLAQESRSGILCVLGSLLNNLFFSYWTPLCVDYEHPVRVHDELLKALRARDSYAAEQCMKEHIEKAKEFLDTIRNHVEVKG